LAGALLLPGVAARGFLPDPAGFFGAAALAAGSFDASAFEAGDLEVNDLEAGDLRDLLVARSFISDLPVSGQWHPCAAQFSAARNLSVVPPARQSR
jgi:hypothetical protein